MAASLPQARHIVAHVPLAFESGLDGKLLAREGPYSVVVEAGKTTAMVYNSTKHRVAAVVTTLAASNSASRPRGAGPLGVQSNYLLGKDPSGWRHAAMFSRAEYRRVYPGIDLVFHGTTGLLEYDFIVYPFADPGRIAMEVSGGSDIQIERDGALVIQTDAGTIRWKKPEVYQWRSGVRQPVEGRFVLSGRSVTFALGIYDHSQELIIDPTLAYATYLGGADNEASRGVAVDGAGNIYVTGYSFSIDLPHTGGSIQASYRGGTMGGEFGGDAFVAKYTPSGSLVYVTYLGGKGDDAGDAIAVDSAGNAYITGYTSSSDFPVTTGAYQTKFGGSGGSGKYLSGLGAPFGDAFVAKLNPAGTALTYATYLGGSLDEKAAAITIDAAGNAYVGGSTMSANFPTSNPYQLSFKGAGGSPPFCCGDASPFISNGDGFVTAINSTGTGLLFSTYLGGTLDDGVTAIAVDKSGNVYAGGFTLSANFPIQNAVQSKYGGAASQSAQPVITMGDGFVTKFDSTGKLVYSTYLGGSRDDAVMALAVDATGAVYVTGLTSSADFPGISANAAQKIFAGPTSIHDQTGFLWGDAFVAKLAPAGNALAYATYLGGSNDDAGMAIAIDGAGNAIVGGFAMSKDLKVSTDALQKTWAGAGAPFFTDPTGDAFLAKVSPDGSSFSYLSYYGGSSSEAITGIALDGQGNVIVTGPTTSTNFPITGATAAQKVFGGQSSITPTEDMGDAFVAVFSGIGVGASPVITSVLNGATNSTTISPGADVNVLGTNLPANASAGALVGGQSVQVVFASATQWIVLIPYSASAAASTIQIGTSAPFNITLSSYAPGLFTLTGTGIVAATHGSGNSVISQASPALPGEVVALNATGLGAIDNSGHPTTLPSISVGNVAAKVMSVAVTNPGSYQVTVQLDGTTPSGNQPVILTIGGVNSPPAPIPVGLLSSPIVTDAQNGASFQPGVVANSWLTIKGGLLSQATDTWTNAVVNGVLPVKLDNVSVTVGNKPAYIYFVSAGQVNVVVPDIAAGPTTVTVTGPAGTSNSYQATASIFGPAFFLWPGGYAVATRTDYSLAVKNGTFGVATTPAKPGDIIILWGMGFGPTKTPTPVGIAVPSTGDFSAANDVMVKVGNVQATVYGAALAAGAAALYQVAIQVPPNLPDGDYPVVATVNGVSSPVTTLITVQH